MTINKALLKKEAQKGRALTEKGQVSIKQEVIAALKLEKMGLSHLSVPVIRAWIAQLVLHPVHQIVIQVIQGARGARTPTPGDRWRQGFKSLRLLSAIIITESTDRIMNYNQIYQYCILLHHPTLSDYQLMYS